MNLSIDRESCVPVYKQIAREIEERILSKELPEGYKLPSERRLAAELGTHRNTVIKAYDCLICNGLVAVSREKPKGYFVKIIKSLKDDEAESGQTFGTRFFPLEKAFRYELRKAEKKFNDLFVKSESGDIISFAGLAMNRKLNPVKGMEHVVSKIFDDAESGAQGDFYQETEHLCENICKLLAEQNIYVSKKNIQIFAESNQIISYLMMLYVREGDCIIAEEPMVPDNYSIFYNRGIKVVTIPMEPDGMRMDMLEEAIRENKPKFIYTLPNFHNPTGITMSLEKRRMLLKLADRYNVPIIEEDYQRDFNYEGRCLPSLYMLDSNKLVIYVYSFTLIFPYMMKIGYAVGPSDLIDMMGYALSIDETFVSGIGQYFLNAYIDSGEFERHVQIVQKEYSNKLELLCSELNKLKEKGLSYVKPTGGLLVWCTLDDGINERAFCKIAEQKGVLVVPGWVFYANNKKKKNHIRICFSNVTDEEICQGVELLGEALDICRIG